MTLENMEGKSSFIISPRLIQKVSIFDEQNSLELLEKMEENTTKFAKKLISKLISTTTFGDEEVKKYLDFHLILCDDYENLPKGIDDPIKYIMDNKEKVIAIFEYIKSSEQIKFFTDYMLANTKQINNYAKVYLDFEKLLKILEIGDITFNVYNPEDRYGLLDRKDEAVTNFVVSYNPKKDLEHKKNLSC